MQVTIKEIAKRCRVSVPAVSQALNDTGRISEKTRQRILRTAAQMGYMPNNAARATRIRRFNSIALLLPATSHGAFLPNNTVLAIHDELDRKGYSLTVARLPDQKLTDEGFIPNILRELSVDGLLVNYIFGVPTRMVDLLQEHRLPLIWLNRALDYDCVRPDDAGGTRMAVEHLINQGHRDITYIDYSAQHHYSAKHRETAYQAAMKHAGLEPRSINKRLNHRDARHAKAFTRDLLMAPDRPTALIGYADFEMFVALGAASSLGIRIPGDLSLVAHTSGGEAQHGFDGTRVVLPESLMGRTAVDMLLKKINQPGEALPAQILPCRFTPGSP